MGSADKVLLESMKMGHRPSTTGSGPSTSPTGTQSYLEGDTEQIKKPFAARMIESFKRDPTAATVKPEEVTGDDGRSYDIEAAAAATANSPLLRKLKGRHLQMIAIGGSIGTGLFIGSGRALAQGGPGSVLIAYCLIGMMMYFTIQALGEMAVMFPVAGAFAAYSSRFLDPAWGFAMGWNYAMQWLITMAVEIVAASITIDYWQPNLSLNAAWVALFWVMIVSINLFGVRGYGEAEFVFSIVKVIAVIGYIILGTIINIDGGNGGGYIGFKFWRDPGAFNHGFKGLCSVFVTAAFAFAGTEMVGLAAAETENPRKTLPTAAKQVFWRITLFYVISLLIVGTLVPYTDGRLLSGKSDYDAKASPFVLSIEMAGIQVLPSVMNAVILVSVLSVGNSSIYGSSRTLCALAEQRQAPRCLAYIDRKGRPLVAIALGGAIGLLAFLSASVHQTNIFGWMIALSGLSSIFTWGSVCLCHIRFRRALKVQGFGLDELAWKSPTGVYGSYVGFVMNVLILIAQFWTGFAPINYETMSTSDLVVNFFQAYLAAPVVLAFYLGYKLWFRPPIIKLRDIDLHTGKRDFNVKSLLIQEKLDREQWPKWKKIYKFVC